MQQYEKIREEALNRLTEPGRSITASHFWVRPKLEHVYLERISREPEYLDIYKRWVLTQGPLHIPDDEDLFKLREGIFRVKSESGILKSDRPLLYLFIDMMDPFIGKSLDQALTYYKLENEQLSEEQIENIVLNTAAQALDLCDKDMVYKSGYPDLQVAFLEMFRAVLSRNIGSLPIIMPVDTAEFIGVFHSEWQRLLPYSDFLYGFEVMPRFSPEDIFRYLRIPFENKKHLSLHLDSTYQQTMNYVASIASSFKPHICNNLRPYYRQKLIELFNPLIEKLIYKGIRTKCIRLNQEEIPDLEKSISKDLPEIIARFDYFYASKNNLINKKISPFEKLFFPMRGWLVKIGHLAHMDEYPLTDYLAKKIKEKIKSYFPAELKCEADLTENTMIEDNGFSEDSDIADESSLSPEEVHNPNEIPAYDAVDHTGATVGWRRDTFSRIVNVGKSTLRTWDERGFLVPKRYHTNEGRRDIDYRVYVGEDVNKALEVKVKMKKRLSL